MANQRRVDRSREEREQRNGQIPAAGMGDASLFPSTASGYVTDRWLDLAERADPACDPATRMVRRLCGRWVGRRCVQLGLTEARLATITELDATAVELLELGLAGEDLISEAGLERLALALAGDDLDADWVGAVVDVAVGRREAHAQGIADQAAEALRGMLN